MGQRERADAIKQYRDIATSAALKGSANPIDVAIAMHRGAQFAVRQMDYRRMMGLEQAGLPYAIGEARAKGISVEETMTAMIEGMHQAGIYDPAGVEEIHEGFPIRRCGDAGHHADIRSGSRVLPGAIADDWDLRLRDRDPGHCGASARRHHQYEIGNMDCGITTRQLLPDGKDKNDAAMQEMGLIDDKGNTTWHATNADGSENYRTELLNQSSILNTFADKQKARGDIGKETINRDIQYAFGKQGGSFAAFLGDDAFRKQIGNLSGGNNGYKGGDAMLDWMQEKRSDVSGAGDLARVPEDADGPRPKPDAGHPDDAQIDRWRVACPRSRFERTCEGHWRCRRYADLHLRKGAAAR